MLDETISQFRRAVFNYTIRNCDLCKEAHAPNRTCEEAAAKRELFKTITQR